jgi:hypothetical protein
MLTSANFTDANTIGAGWQPSVGGKVKDTITSEKF